MIHNGMLFNLCTLYCLFQTQKLTLPKNTMMNQWLSITCIQFGHFQANGLMAPFATQLYRLDRRLKQMYDEDEEDGIEADLLAGYMPVVEGIACQGYNMLSHRVHSQGRYHDVQLRHITAALLGTHQTSGMNHTTAQWFAKECEDWLPFEWYHEKVTGGYVDTLTRVENVYCISLHRILARMWNGRYVTFQPTIACKHWVTW